MMTQILRTIDRWRFETPLAVGLGAAAGFVALSAPAQLFAQVPVAGDMGTAGRAIVAAALAVVAGGAGYVAMRKPVKAEPEPADPFAEIPEEERPSGMPAERFARFRRADAHPDAPPREPIIASRDLGEPFMDVAAAAPAARPEADADEPWWPDSTIPDGDYVELPEDAVAHPAPAVVEAPAVEVEPEVAPDVVAAEPAPIPAVAEAVVAEAPVAPRPAHTSISAMMERLSAGLERRATVPPRDPGPALRNALAELNRLAERRD